MDAVALLDQYQLESRPAQIEQMTFEELAGLEQDHPPAAGRRKAPARGVAAPVSGRHQDVRLCLTVMLKTYAEMTDAGLVRDAPFEARLSPGIIYQPDVVFVASSNFDRVYDTYLDGPPDIVVEVLSAESTALDRGEKFVAYERAGVREYWLVDPLRELVDLYHLGPDSYYGEFRPDIAGRLRSRVLKSFTLDTDLLWKRVLPTTAEIVELAQAMLSQR